MNRRLSRYAMAVHEAGHLVVAHRFGWRIAEAGVFAKPVPCPDQPYVCVAGHVAMMPSVALGPLNAPLRRLAWHAQSCEQLVILVAGHVAQKRARPRSPDGARGDRSAAAVLSVLLARTVEGQALLLRAARFEAKAMVEADWPLILRLANAFAAVRGCISWPSIEPLIAAYDREQSEFFKTLPLPTRMPTPDEVERSIAQRQMAARRVRRGDVEAAAILAITRLIAEKGGEPEDLMLAALKAISDRRGIEPGRLMAKWERVLRDEAAARAWHPVGKSISRQPRGRDHVRVPPWLKRNAGRPGT